MQKLRNAIIILLAVGFGFLLTAQTTTLPGIQGYYPTGKVYIPVQVDVNGKLITTGGGGGGGCTAPCAVEGASAIGTAASPPVTTGYQDDSSNAQADFGFPDQAAFGTTGTDLVILAGTTGKQTWVGHVSFSLSAVETVTIQQGTGTTCGTNTVVLYGPAPNISAIALDYDSKSPLHTTVTGRDLCIHLGSSATFGGGLVYGSH